MNSTSPGSHSDTAPESPLSAQLDELQRTQSHSFELLNQVEDRLLVNQQAVSGGPLKGVGDSPAFGTELQNRIHSRHMAAVGLNQRLMDLLERI